MNTNAKPELLGFRDSRYSHRHRYHWGNHMYYGDLDSIEYGKDAMPKCMIELKHGKISEIELFGWQLKCLRNTADMIKLPLFIVVYYPTGFDQYTKLTDQFGPHWQFYVIPGNVLGQAILQRPLQMSEAEYVAFLYRLRGETLDAAVEASLDHTVVTVPLPKIIGR